jgi:hypothetical protein
MVNCPLIQPAIPPGKVRLEHTHTHSAHTLAPLAHSSTLAQTEGARNDFVALCRPAERLASDLAGDLPTGTSRIGDDASPI